MVKGIIKKIHQLKGFKPSIILYSLDGYVRQYFITQIDLETLQEFFEVGQKVDIWISPSREVLRIDDIKLLESNKDE